jgi:hypothetical protein
MLRNMDPRIREDDGLVTQFMILYMDSQCEYLGITVLQYLSD